MAKGKHAVSSANRRAEAAHQIIDRLTTELADQKMRAKKAEERAARLEGIEALLARADAKQDEMLQASLDKNRWWQNIAKEDYKRRRAATVEMFTTLAKDLKLPASNSVEDVRQFLFTRYPAVMEALTAGSADGPVPPGDVGRWSDDKRGVRGRLTDEQLRRFERFAGLRQVVADKNGVTIDKDVSEVWIDMLDAEQVGFSKADILEFAIPTTAD